MAPPWLSTLASIGMAVGPPLVYVDQTVSIIKKKYALFTCSTDSLLIQLRYSEILRGFLETFVPFCAQIIPFLVLIDRLVDQVAGQYHPMLLLAWRAL